MKKLVCLVFALTVTLAACGDATPSPSPSAQSAVKTFAYKGVEIVMGAKMDDFIAAAGEPVRPPYEETSCAFEGLDKIFTYPGFEITTYPDKGVDYIYTATIKSADVKTAKGVTIGQTKDEIKALMGTPKNELDKVLEYVIETGGTATTLAVIFDAEGKSADVSFENAAVLAGG